MYFQMQDGWLNLNGKWDDRTVNVLITNKFPISDVNLVVTREPLTKSMGLSAYVDNMRKNLTDKLSHLSIIADADGEFQGYKGHFFEISWIDKGKAIHQLIMLIHIEEIVLSFSATAPGAMDAETRSELMNVLRSFRTGRAPNA